MKDTKIAQGVKFNIIKTLFVVEQDEILNDTFRKQNNVEYNLLRSIAKQGLTNSETEDLLKEMFNDIILTKKSLLDLYVNADDGGVSDTPNPKEKKLPRRYGKDKIEADIEKQGGKPTETQRAMLAVNELKNIYVNLSARGIKDMLGDTNLLSDSDCRDIVAVVTTVKKKLKNILKRKK